MIILKTFFNFLKTGKVSGFVMTFTYVYKIYVEEFTF